LVYHGEDFGQTLAVWGTDEGIYLMLPLFGPSNPRDGIGLIVDFLIDPVNWYARDYDRVYLTYGRAGAHAVDYRSRNIELLDELEETSIDYYTAIRSLYRQRRADEIANGRPSANVPAPGISGPAAEGPDGTKVSEAK
ncbi:MAG: VacJ family lipoprotein, partial [Alphaproteobacteria bacterium]|nr:VacJ family lipoprotein [Alphaproteobacteria bacterium]